MTGRTLSTQTPLISILLFALAAIFGAAGQFLYKSGAESASGSVLSYINLRILGGVFCYIAVMVLIVAAFRKRVRLTVLYPVYASTFIWASVIAMLAYGQPVEPAHEV